MAVVIVSLLMAIRLGSASTERVVTEPALQAVGSPPPTLGAGCRVTGDMVGDGNPATVANALCGP
jgi:hypothetical protein